MYIVRPPLAEIEFSNFTHAVAVLAELPHVGEQLSSHAFN